jgi:hypothetical protein
MTGEAFEEALAGFRRWAGRTDRELCGDLEEDVAELSTVFGLMPDYLGTNSPEELTESSLRQLLLHVYPRKVTVLDRNDTTGTVPAMRDLTAYLADTGAVMPAVARALSRELDEIEPEFADAVMDPANWGPATALMHAMHRDKVDMDDTAAVDAWIARQNRGVLGRGGLGDGGFGGSSFAGSFAVRVTWDGADLKADFGVPGIVAPVRLPDTAELASLAGAAPLLADVLRLARDVREKPVEAASVDPFLLTLAAEAAVVEGDGDSLVPGEDVEWLDDLSGEDPPLDAWNYAFAHVLDSTLETADEVEPRVGAELDLTGHGIAMMVELFQGPRAGVPVAELSASLKSAAVAEIPADDAEAQWQEWVDAHGDPADLLLEQLAKLSAVAVDGGTARLEPLGLLAVTEKLRACDVKVPEFPPAAEMTADDVALLFALADGEDFTADFDLWTAARTPEVAARELLAFAANAQVTARAAAVQVVSRLGAAAELAWREALERPQLRCYAKPELLKFRAEGNPGQPAPPELKPTVEDMAWIIADTFSPLTRIISGSVTFPFDTAALGDGDMNITHEHLFDAIARLDHPDAEPVLTMIGRHCDDKKTAKAARKAAFKAASRRGSRRG